MPDAPRTVVQFQSAAFNSTQPRDYFINPDCFGDDVARWLVERLRGRGVDCNEPDQEDWGWYIDFSLGDQRYSAHINRDIDGFDGHWLMFIHRPRTFMQALLGKKLQVSLEATEAVHAALAGAEEVHSVCWHDEEAFHAGKLDAGSAVPGAA